MNDSRIASPVNPAPERLSAFSRVVPPARPEDKRNYVLDLEKIRQEVEGFPHQSEEDLCLARRIQRLIEQALENPANQKDNTSVTTLQINFFLNQLRSRNSFPPTEPTNPSESSVKRERVQPQKDPRYNHEKVMKRFFTNALRELREEEPGTVFRRLFSQPKRH